MLKNIFQLMLGVLMLIAPFAVHAQDGQMPLMPNVKTGVLPNGLTYYILHNEEPKGRANFYIAQKVGSTLEMSTQLGLAHFLEHMAFNGTANFPGKNMLNYLQSKSLRFGADINAYTGFDETVYNIDNVPTSDQALMDSVLLALRDWSCAITLDGDEIDAERKVIQEEWRSRDNAFIRFYTAMLPQIYQEYQYQQMPIGKMEVVMNFPHDDLRSYYHKWYRPDLQGIVVVGDFDADAMEQKVKDLFSTIEMPENPAPRVYPAVSDNKEPIYFEYADKEAPQTMVDVYFKKESVPFEQRNTVQYYLMNYVNTLVTMMMDNRLNEFAQTPECEYSSAGVAFGSFAVSKTREAFNVTIVPKNNIPLATQQGLEIVARACKTGFTESEYTRVKDELRSQLERRNNERDKTQNTVLARKIISHFTDNDALPGPEVDLQFFDQVIEPNISLALVNQAITDMMTPENQIMVVFMPEKEGVSLPGKQTMLGVLEGAMNKTYEAYQDEVITEPLVKKFRKAGKVTQTEVNDTYGIKTYTLSNGAKVIVKTTDFAADQINFTCLADGGLDMCNPADQQMINNYLMLPSAVESSLQGTFNYTMMTKYLSGKQAGVSFQMNQKTHGFGGFSTKKDLETMMEMIYSYFTQVKPDNERYAVTVDKKCDKIERDNNNPLQAFSDSLSLAMYNGDPRVAPSTPASVKAANYAAMLAEYNKMVANAADYTFIFVGNVDEATIIPMLEKYIASLPSKKKASKPAVKYPFNLYAGTKTVAFEKPMQTPATVYYSFTSGDANVNAINDINVDIAGDILGNLFTEIIREKEGAAYSPGAAGQMNSSYKRWQLISVIQTNREQQERAFELADEELGKLLKGEVSEDQFSKVKSAAMNQFDINVRTNKYWLQTLREYVLGLSIYDGYKESLDNLTFDAFKTWLRSLKPANKLTVIMTGVPEQK